MNAWQPGKVLSFDIMEAVQLLNEVQWKIIKLGLIALESRVSFNVSG